ncbi:hypothetical protein ABZY44_03130 [Streptomyces sp. NPDC006544]|uniref:hypothetical protein n=1 Tax=Streptomyces sp. NPDC006544 TaxID=3154583 RepID=UPI0033AABCDA
MLNVFKRSGSMAARDRSAGTVNPRVLLFPVAVRRGGQYDMVLALLLFVAVGFLVAVTPGAVLGYFVVAVSRRRPLGVRVALLLGCGVALSLAWLVRTSATGVVELDIPVAVLPFVATLVSGFSFLSHQTHQRRALQAPPVVWPGWAPAADAK